MKNNRMNNFKSYSKDLEKENSILYEKWIGLFKSFRNSYNVKPKIFVRQFSAPGFYEAYEKVYKYSERMSVDVIWFKEKRSCEEFYRNKNFIQLEEICTYCNNIFNINDPIPCEIEKCNSIFCSRECVTMHKKIKHIKKTSTQK
ncbi:MAG: hypothetical protein ACPKQO_06350 [Nitrososphaeraceae archaeon]